MHKNIVFGNVRKTPTAEKEFLKYPILECCVGEIFILEFQSIETCYIFALAVASYASNIERILPQNIYGEA